MVSVTSSDQRDLGGEQELDHHPLEKLTPPQIRWETLFISSSLCLFSGRMGQPASSPAVEGMRFVAEAEAFHQKVLLIRPPHFIAENTSGLLPLNNRLMRSVCLRTVMWNGDPLFPEQWQSVLGNQSAAVYFFTSGRRSGTEVKSTFEYCIDRVRAASPDVKIFAVQWGGPETDAEKLLGVEDSEKVSEKSQSSEEEDGIAAAVNTVSVQDMCGAAGVPLYYVGTDAEQFLFQCLISPLITPSPIGRPLNCLLYQLQEACGASEGYILDSATFMPLQSTLDVDSDDMDCVQHRMCGVLYHNMRQLALDAGSDIHFVSIPCSGSHVIIGWACRPYAYVALVFRPGSNNESAVVSLLAVEKNVEWFAQHFYNVINNNTRLRQHTPMLESVA
jgi:hypothetical protein